MAVPIDPSEPLRNARHEAFARASLVSESDVEAYRKAGYTGKPENKRASEIRAMPGIEPRIRWLKAQAIKRVSDEFAWNRIDLLNWALEILMTPVEKIGPSHPLAQEITTIRTGIGKDHRVTKKVKMVSKMDAARLINGIMGWDKGTESEQKLASVEENRWLAQLEGVWKKG